MSLEGFNHLAEDQAKAVLLNCCAAPKWVSAMLTARPFASPAALAEAACNIWAQMTEPDWLQAFEAHPKIGDVDSLKRKYAATRDMAGSEQSSVQAATEVTLQSLARLNAEYEKKFGFIFIVFASGKSAQEMLELLRARINNSRQEELVTAAAEQLKITLLRLEALA